MAVKVYLLSPVRVMLAPQMPEKRITADFLVHLTKLVPEAPSI
jgi:hypothetical protein